MSAPRIRVDEGATEFERQLLRSWEDERPPAHAREKALGLLGAGAALGATSTTTAAGAVGGAIVQAAAPKAATLGMLAVAKWVAAGSVLAAGVVSVAPYVRSPAASPASLVAPAPASSMASLVNPAEHEQQAPAPGLASDLAPPPELAAPREEPARAPEQAPTVAVEPKAPARPVVVAARPAALVASVPAPRAAPQPQVAEPQPIEPQAVEEKHGLRALGDQVSSIDRARGALASGDAAGAVRIVDEYEAKFPNGSLSQEATVLRIEALVKEGDRQGAGEAGHRFLAAHPSSPHAAKVRQLLDGLDHP